MARCAVRRWPWPSITSPPPPGAAVLLVGSGGMGKTHTLRELVRRLLRADMVRKVVDATAQPGDTIATLLGHQSEDVAAETGAALFALGHDAPRLR